ncbi:MAG TPA: tetratricopeptide repeat protein [Cellvibrio sp.]
MRNYTLSLLCLSGYLLTGCSTPVEHEATLRDLDMQSSQVGQAPVFVKPKSEEEVRQAYDNYLRTAGSEEKGRRAAMGRLAELEMKKLKELEDSQDASQQGVADAAQIASLQNTIDLFNKALEEYPDAKDNDQILYKLAQNYDKLGRDEESLAVLRRLTEQFPQSVHYPEAQFRIGEYAFITDDYLSAETAYSEVIFAGEAHPLYEQALMKRGWSRYKQGLNPEAIEDFTQAIKQRKFGNEANLADKDKSDFNEYFRALALAAKNLPDLALLNDFFNEPEQQPYIYQTYLMISNLQVMEKRYALANQVMNQFITTYPDATEVPDALLQTITILRISEQVEQYTVAMESFYQSYNLDSPFWNSRKATASYQHVKDSMRDNILLVADAQQNAYRRTKQASNLAQAEKWYKRYLSHYSVHARQDKVYIAYGELLAARGDNAQALELFEKAAYDGEILLDKEAAYATIDLTDKLYRAEPNNKKWLEKHLAYSAQSARLYSTEDRYQKVSLHAVELAYKNQRYDDVLSLTNTLNSNLSKSTQIEASYIKALALLKLNRALDAENILTELAKQATTTEARTKFQEAQALAIYQQGKDELTAQNNDKAIAQYVRIAQQLPKASIAADALYEAINLSITNQLWPTAAATIELFQKLYAGHPNYKDATRQLSNVYLKLGQSDRAALVFEKISAQDSDKSVQMAALWQAAELYETKDKLDDAIRTYVSYANTYTSPYPQYMESMNKLVELYGKKRDNNSVESWREKILSTDKKTIANYKTDRTNFIAAQAALALANAKQAKFAGVQLREPLTQRLREKKQFMQEAINLYGEASSYRVATITTESAYAIGDIYQHFSKALLTSERPANLSPDELEQYDILLEDQAFPFEEKAIEFHEINIARSADGTESKWIKESFNALKTLFPSRYARAGKADVYREGGVK